MKLRRNTRQLYTNIVSENITTNTGHSLGVQNTIIIPAILISQCPWEIAWKIADLEVGLLYSGCVI